MEYNSTRSQLFMPEYGRNVQKLIEYALAIEDREERTHFAHLIVNIMSQMNPKMKDSGDYKQKLWDHLIMISDFRLDVDAPFPYPSREVLKHPPKRITYKEEPIKYRHYGRNMEKIIQKAIDFEDGPEKDYLIRVIANHLKKSYLNWNRDSVNDELIFKHLEELSNGKLKVDKDFKLNETSDILARSKRKKFTGKQREYQGNGKGKSRKSKRN
ncbi:MAG: DUF4290 domain-containing protein [Bacteroidales bacterium]